MSTAVDAIISWTLFKIALSQFCLLFAFVSTEFFHLVEWLLTHLNTDNNNNSVVITLPQSSQYILSENNKADSNRDKQRRERETATTATERE